MEIAVGMTEGAMKYGRHNYRAVNIRASVYYDAVFRHMMAWFEGEDIDEPSQLSHITKAICTLVVLRDSMMQNKLCDDRPIRSAPFMDEVNQKTERLFHSITNPVAPYTELGRSSTVED
jgi:dATP/dGTP diphosphohydrolase, N-terminal